MRYVAGCLFSAVLGAWFALILTDFERSPHALAQDRGGRRGPGFPSGPPVESKPRPPAQPQFNELELTPEEVVNVNVYEKNNKGVVNITLIEKFGR